jgi:YfiH family protein
MLRKSVGKIQWLEFELFQEIPDFTHGVFLRHGGFSEGAYSSLNVGKMSGDSLQIVEKNIQAIRNVTGFTHLATGLQCHGTQFNEVRESADFRFDECDGLITQREDVGLLIKHADCQAAIFVDPVRRLLANVHAGWRGNVANIYQKAVQELCKMGSRPEEILVGISPSLGPEASEFLHYKTEFPEPFWDFQHKPHYFDLWAITRWQLQQCGILPHHIEIASICTYSCTEDFFSYRREKLSGRHATIAGFKS